MKKGFTLIELLAVIVILAIIAVIAVPIVINIIDDSKKNATLRSTEMYMEAVNQGIARKQLTQNIKSGTYEIMEDGNLCYITNSECTQENKIDVEVKGDTLKSGTIIIDEGEVKSLDIRDKENVDGLVIVRGEISDKKIDESTGESTFVLSIYFDQNLGNISVSTIMSMLKYDPQKYTYKRYYYGDWGGDNYTTGRYSDNVMSTMTIEDSNITIIDGTIYIKYRFSTNDLDNVQESDFTYYIKMNTTQYKNVPVQQKSNTSMKVLNYINDFRNHFSVKPSQSYDYAPGDINNDNYIDSKDLLLLEKYVYELESITPCKAMDLNGDGDINTNDIILLKKYLSGSSDIELKYSTITDIPGHL